MAAAETACVAGTRRAVIRSERFVQWQRELSSARRAPYGSRKRTDGDPSQQKESAYVSALKDSGGMEVEGGEFDGYHSDVSKATVKKQEQIQQQQSPDCKCAEKHITSANIKDDGLLILREADLCNGRTNSEQSQQEQMAGPQQQHELGATHPVKRRGRQPPNKDQDLKPSTRGAGDDVHAKIASANGLTSKRSTRLLTRTLRADEPPPPPPLKFPKLHVVLSRKEVQEDWLKMTGRRYTGKPRKSALTHLGLGLCTSLTCPSTIRRYLDLTDP